MTLLGVHELVHADGIAFGNHRPVVDLAVHARNLIGGELEDLERDVLALERRGVATSRRPIKRLAASLRL